MLIQTPYTIGDTVSLKLTSGEEIIARLGAENDKTFTLHKPLVMIVQQQGMGLAPFMFSVDPDTRFYLQAHSVACIAKTEKDIASQYTQQTTGLTVLTQ